MNIFNLISEHDLVQILKCLFIEQTIQPEPLEKCDGVDKEIMSLDSDGPMRETRLNDL